MRDSPGVTNPSPKRKRGVSPTRAPNHRTDSLALGARITWRIRVDSPSGIQTKWSAETVTHSTLMCVFGLHELPAESEEADGITINRHPAHIPETAGKMLGLCAPSFVQRRVGDGQVAAVSVPDPYFE